MEETLIVCEGLSKQYGAKRALDQVDLTLGRGRIVGLLGPTAAARPPGSSCCAACCSPPRAR